MVEVFVITEDTSKSAFPTLISVCGAIFDFIVPRCMDDQCVAFGPVDDRGRNAMGGNFWKSTNPRDQRKIIGFCRTIATRLLKGDFVCFHVDGDRLWAARTTSENLTKFERAVARQVREILRGELPKQYPLEDCDALLDEGMGRLLCMAPFYSIETWLFANVELLRRICSRSGRLPGDLDARLGAWQSDLSALDGEWMPKAAVVKHAKIGDHYPELAAKLRTAELHGLQTSFHATVERIRSCQPLLDQLRDARPHWVKDQDRNQPA